VSVRHPRNAGYYLRDADGGAGRAAAGVRAPGAVRKIAALRANALGDFIFALPALEALQQCYPAAEIVLLGNAWHRDFLAGRPGPVDRVIVVPKCDGVPHQSHRVESPAEVGEFFDRMRGEAFDIAFQLHGGGRHSNPFVRRLGARMTVGLQDRDAVPLDVSIPYSRHQNEVLRYREVVQAVGAV
jgi:ADP-heptose:LPS heptosyltransferase